LDRLAKDAQIKPSGDKKTSKGRGGGRQAPTFVARSQPPFAKKVGQCPMEGVNR